jgi:hypothetical protein
MHFPSTNNYNDNLILEKIYNPNIQKEEKKLKRGNSSNNKRNNLKLISAKTPKTNDKISITDNIKLFSKENLKVSLKKNNDNKIKTGEYTSKLKILLGLNKKEELTNTRFINVKCIGLKLDLDFHRDNFSSEKINFNNKNSENIIEKVKKNFKNEKNNK